MRKSKDIIYPTRLGTPLDQALGNIRVRSLAFSIDGDLEQAGWMFLRELDHALGSDGRLISLENASSGYGSASD